MAYRLEDTDQGTKDLVIDGFEKGIAPSPYLGIANIRNLNTTYYPGVAYVNYRRQAASLTYTGPFFFAGAHSTNVSGNLGWIFSAQITTGAMTNPVQKATSPAGLNYILDDSGQIWKQTAVNGSTFNILGDGIGRVGHGAGGIAYWNNYLVVFGAGLIEFCGKGTSDADVIPANWNIYNYNYLTAVVFTSGGPPTTLLSFTALFSITAGEPLTFTTTGTLPAPLIVGQTYYATSSAASGSTFTLALTPGGSSISFTTTGTGTHTLHRITISLPNGNVPTLTFTADVTIGSTSATIATYTLPNGSSATTLWLLASGLYNIVDSNGNNILAEFTNDSSFVTFLQPTVQYQTGAVSVYLLNTATTNYKAYISKVDGNLYFANGRFLGRIVAENANTNFNPAVPDTYVVDYAATAILQASDSIVDMTDLKSELVIAGQFDTYTWDYLSSNVTAPSPVGETIFKLINILSNIYILAGQKGNIYVSNGYSSQLLCKIPDYITGILDPVWAWGDVMFHRSRLFFQSLAKSTAGANILAGVFSVIVSPSMLGEAANGIFMEAQNSYGLTPASGAKSNGVLIDNEPSANGNDSYYSAWSNGASTGGIDYNDTSLWQNFEPTIETDIIPIGTFLNKRTLGLIEFKLDRPMATGDQIRMYAKTSLSDTYTLLGTTTTSQLSDSYQTNVFQAQWVQFQVQMKCASSSSSFIPIREIRLHLS